MKTVAEKVLERLNESDDRSTAEDLIDLLTRVNLKDLLRMCEIDQHTMRLPRRYAGRVLEKSRYTEAVVKENQLDIEALRRVIAMFEETRKK